MGDVLFEDRVRDDRSPPAVGEPLFDYVDRMAGVLWDNVRAHLSEWVHDFPDEHRRELLGRLRSRSDPVDFYAAYWELLLHQLLTRSGFAVECHPAVPGTAKRPDFRAVRGDEVVYVEAKLIGNSADERRRQREKDEIWTELDRRVSSEQFFVRLGVLERGHGAIPHRLLAAETTKWLASLDVDVVRAAVAIGGLGAVEKFVWRDTGSGWVVSLAPIPKTRHLLSHRLVGMGEAEAWFSDDRGAIRRALADKGRRYGGGLDGPLVVALSMGRSFVDDFDVVNALFGDEVVHVRHDTKETSLSRAGNGVWTGPEGPRAQRLSAVLVGKNIGPWNLGSAELALWTNPWASRSTNFAASPVTRVVPTENGMDRRTADASVLEWLELPAGWPGSVEEDSARTGDAH